MPTARHAASTTAAAVAVAAVALLTMASAVAALPATGSTMVLKYRKLFLLSLLMLIANIATSATRTVELAQADSMRSAQVIYNGRICPLNTAARQFCLKITGSSSFGNLTPEQVLLSWALYPEEWKDVAMIKVKKDEVRRLIGIEGKYARFADFFDSKGNYKLAPEQFPEIDERLSLIGAVIRSLFSEPWMRTSCDIDILVHEEDLERATQELTNAGFTTDGKREYHDVSFFYGSVHLELHFNIQENMEQIDGLLADVWKYTKQFDDMEYRETPDYFLFHHVAHMAYHFVSGGCGIKPFLDLWLMRKNGYYNDKKIMPLLRSCDLVSFYLAVNNLADVWMEGKEHSDLTRRMESYILSGGVYGNSENSNATGAVRKKGKFRYLWSIAFPPYQTMRVIYPSLRKHKSLLPFCYIHRFFSKLFGKNRKRVRSRWKATMNQDQSKIQSMEELLQAVGLK